MCLDLTREKEKTGNEQERKKGGKRDLVPVVDGEAKAKRGRGDGGRTKKRKRVREIETLATTIKETTGKSRECVPCLCMCARVSVCVLKPTPCCGAEQKQPRTTMTGKQAALERVWVHQQHEKEGSALCASLGPVAAKRPAVWEAALLCACMHAPAGRSRKTRRAEERWQGRGRRRRRRLRRKRPPRK